MGKWAAGALCTPPPQGQSSPDRSEVVPALILKESQLPSQAGFFPCCSQPMGVPQKVNAQRVLLEPEDRGPIQSTLLSGGCAGQSDGSDDNGRLLVYGHGP